MTSISLALACPLYATSTDTTTCEGLIWWDRQISLPQPVNISSHWYRDDSEIRESLIQPHAEAEPSGMEPFIVSRFLSILLVYEGIGCETR
jgi:hypothetical protein